MAVENEVKVDVPFNVQILTNVNPEAVCAETQGWQFPTHATNGYTAVNGFADPSDDLSQQWRQVVVDDEQARISQVVVFINKDEDEPIVFNHYWAEANHGLDYTTWRATLYSPPTEGMDETNTSSGGGCLSSGCPTEQHFRGWEVTWEISTGTEVHCFGDCSGFYT